MGGIDVTEVYHLLEKGYRMDRPEGCRIDVYHLMRRCWMWDPKDRPSFKDARHMLDNMFSDKQTRMNNNMDAVASPRPTGKVRCRNMFDDSKARHTDLTGAFRLRRSMKIFGRMISWQPYDQDSKRLEELASTVSNEVLRGNKRVCNENKKELPEEIALLKDKIRRYLSIYKEDGAVCRNLSKQKGVDTESALQDAMLELKLLEKLMDAFCDDAAVSALNDELVGMLLQNKVSSRTMKKLRDYRKMATKWKALLDSPLQYEHLCLLRQKLGTMLDNGLVSPGGNAQEDFPDDLANHLKEVDDFADFPDLAVVDRNYLPLYTWIRHLTAKIDGFIRDHKDCISDIESYFTVFMKEECGCDITKLKDFHNQFVNTLMRGNQTIPEGFDEDPGLSYGIKVIIGTIKKYLELPINPRTGKRLELTTFLKGKLDQLIQSLAIQIQELQPFTTADVTRDDNFLQLSWNEQFVNAVKQMFYARLYDADMATVQRELEFPTRQKMGNKSNDEETKAKLDELKRNVDRTGNKGIDKRLNGGEIHGEFQLVNSDTGREFLGSEGVPCLYDVNMPCTRNAISPQKGCSGDLEKAMKDNSRRAILKFKYVCPEKMEGDGKTKTGIADVEKAIRTMQSIALFRVYGAPTNPNELVVDLINRDKIIEDLGITDTKTVTLPELMRWLKLSNDV